MLAESVCEPTTSLPNVQNLTAGTNDGINDTGRGTAMASFEVYDSVRVVDIGSPSSALYCFTAILLLLYTGGYHRIIKFCAAIFYVG